MAGKKTVTEESKESVSQDTAKRKGIKDKKKAAIKSEAAFTKSKLLKMERFQARQDLLNALLADGQSSVIKI